MTSSASYCAEFEETWKADVYYTENIHKIIHNSNLPHVKYRWTIRCGNDYPQNEHWPDAHH